MRKIRHTMFALITCGDETCDACPYLDDGTCILFDVAVLPVEGNYKRDKQCKEGETV